MRKSYFLLTATLLVILVAFTLYYIAPKQHTKTLHGISFSVDNNEKTNKVSIEIDGKVQKSLLGTKTFDGTIRIKRENLILSPNKDKVFIKFLSNGQGNLVYAGYDNGQPYTYNFGSIYANNDFSKVTILNGDWNSDNGLLITAPASNRKEALQISNELMEEFLENKVIE